MISPDQINGAFEFTGAGFIGCHIRKVLQDKKVAGVSTAATIYFTCWGIWNLYYYPSLAQWWSFIGGLAIVITNFIWILLLLKYRDRSGKNN